MGNEQLHNLIYSLKESPNLLIGWTPIARYSGVCERTAARWTKRHGFPACPLPDGRIMSSKTLIDHWILARHQVAQEMIEKPGDNDGKAQQNVTLISHFGLNLAGKTDVNAAYRCPVLSKIEMSGC